MDIGFIVSMIIVLVIFYYAAIPVIATVIAVSIAILIETIDEIKHKKKK